MNHLYALIGFCVILICSPGCEREISQHIKRDIAGKNTFALGEQIWRSSLLDTDHFLNGDQIPQAQSAKEWEEAGRLNKPTWCYANDDEQSCKLYNWHAIIDTRGIIPIGWHMPSLQELEYVMKLLYTLNHLDAHDQDISTSYPVGYSYEHYYKDGIQVRYSLPFLYHGHRFGNGNFKGQNNIGVCWTKEPLDSMTKRIPAFAQVKEKKQLYMIASHPANGLAVRLLKD